MNNLNSVLIEGEAVDDAGKDLCRPEPRPTVFTIASKRFYKSAEGIAEEITYIDIESTGKLAENCLNVIRKGRGVRVVGLLSMRRDAGKCGYNYTHCIVAEHVEIRPEFKKWGGGSSPKPPTGGRR
jgi:single-stranded DNA-binding protein